MKKRKRITAVIGNIVVGKPFCFHIFGDDRIYETSPVLSFDGSTVETENTFYIIDPESKEITTKRIIRIKGCELPIIKGQPARIFTADGRVLNTSNVVSYVKANSHVQIETLHSVYSSFPNLP